MMYTAADRPVGSVIDRAKVLPFTDVDPFKFTPPGGFLKDVENYMLGFETTNAFSFWSGVHFLSTMLKRDLWLPWGESEKHFANFYIILLAYPGLVKKSTALRLLTPIYDRALEKITNPALLWKKNQELVISSMATANGMFKFLEELSGKETSQFQTADGSPLQVEADTNLVIRVSELTTLLSRAQYQVNLIDKLTDFYDCKDYDSSTTVSHGHMMLKNIFCTLMGATTPSSFQGSMTLEAYGGGFMSRCIVVKEDSGYRQYPLPATYRGIPSQEDMAARLAFIGEHNFGQRGLSPEAYDLYSDWYVKFKTELQREDPEEILHQDNRRDINVLKLALVLTAQDYRLLHEIPAEYIDTAIKILDYTIGKAANDVNRAAVSPENILISRLYKYILKFGSKGTTKRQLLQTHSKTYTAKKMNEILEHLFEADMIDIRNLTGPDAGKIKSHFEGVREVYIAKVTDNANF